jgi:hypothetical protein
MQKDKSLNERVVDKNNNRNRTVLPPQLPSNWCSGESVVIARVNVVTSPVFISLAMRVFFFFVPFLFFKNKAWLLPHAFIRVYVFMCVLVQDG